MSETPTPEAQAEGEQQAEQTFTQADVDRIVRERVKRERDKFADYDELKAKAGTATTLEERVAEIEARAVKAETDALRAKYAADVPERLRPLLTGTTDDELKAQRDLIVEGESERVANGNHVPREGETPTPAAGDPMREMTRQLFARATSD